MNTRRWCFVAGGGSRWAMIRWFRLLYHLDPQTIAYCAIALRYSPLYLSWGGGTPLRRATARSILKHAARHGIGRRENATRVVVAPPLPDIVCLLSVCLPELDLEPETVFRVVCQSITKRVLFVVGWIRKLLHSIPAMKWDAVRPPFHATSIIIINRALYINHPSTQIYPKQVLHVQSPLITCTYTMFKSS